MNFTVYAYLSASYAETHAVTTGPQLQHCLKPKNPTPVDRATLSFLKEVQCHDYLIKKIKNGTTHLQKEQAGSKALLNRKGQLCTLKKHLADKIRKEESEV